MGRSLPPTGSRAGSPKKLSPSDRRRLERRHRGRLVEALKAAEEQLFVAEELGCANDAERLRTEIHGRTYVDFAEGLRYEIHQIDVEGRDRRVREMCERRGVSVEYLAELQRRHDRRVGLRPDQLAPNAGHYRGNHWKSAAGSDRHWGTLR